MPSPFSAFLEEKAGGEENLKQLKHERNHIYESVKTMRDKLRLIDKRIAEIKKEAKPISSPEPSVK
jgi:phage shock protein A